MHQNRKVILIQNVKVEIIFTVTYLHCVLTYTSAFFTYPDKFTLL